MKRSLILLVFASFASITCLAQAGADQDLQSAVTAGNQVWINAMRSGDTSSIQAIYAPDAVDCSADGHCVSGAHAIERQMRARLGSSDRAQNATVNTTSLVRDRDLAYEWGYSEVDFGGDRRTRGRYVTVWQRQPGGGWKILRNISLPFAREGREGRRPGRDEFGSRREESFPLRCESNDMGRHSCLVNYQVSRAEMVRQISGSKCVKDSTWGWSSNALWVDRGCRADFTVYGYVNDAAPQEPDPEPITEYNDTRSTKPVQCESLDMKYHFCAAGGTVRSVRMVRQLSGSACTETQTWGWKSDGVWVDKGCRAEFEVTVR